MTPFDEFKKSPHAPKAAKFFASEAGQAVIKAMEEYHPSRRLPKGHENLGLLTTGAVALLNHGAGYEELAVEFRSITEPAKEPIPEAPDTYQEDEIKSSITTP